MLRLSNLMTRPSVLPILSTKRASQLRSQPLSNKTGAGRLSAKEYRRWKNKFEPSCTSELIAYINKCDKEVVNHPASGLSNIESSAIPLLRGCPGFRQAKCIARQCKYIPKTFTSIFSKGQRAVDTYEEREEGNTNTLA